jgi:hypothetical protein
MNYLEQQRVLTDYGQAESAPRIRSSPLTLRYIRKDKVIGL